MAYEKTLGNYFTGLGQNVLTAPAQYLGATADEGSDLEAWKTNYPTTNLVSSMVSQGAIDYFAGKAIKKIPVVGPAIQKLEDNIPVDSLKGVFAKNAMNAAVGEVGRKLVADTVGEKIAEVSGFEGEYKGVSLSEMALNTIAAGAVSSSVKGIKEMVKKPLPSFLKKATETAPEYMESLAKAKGDRLQVARTVHDILNNEKVASVLAPEEISRAKGTLNTISRDLMNDVSLSTGSPVLDKILKPAKTKNYSMKTYGGLSAAEQLEYRKALSDSFGSDAPLYVKGLRVYNPIKADKGFGEKKAEQLASYMKKFGQKDGDWYVLKSKTKGYYNMFQFHENKGFTYFMTDKPTKFNPAYESWVKGIEAKSLDDLELDPKARGSQVEFTIKNELGAKVTKTIDSNSVKKYISLRNIYDGDSLSDEMIMKEAEGAFGIDSSSTFEKMKQRTKNILSPTMFKFSNNAHASKLWLIHRHATESLKGYARSLITGRVHGTDNLAADLTTKFVSGKNSIESAVADLQKKNLFDELLQANKYMYDNNLNVLDKENELVADMFESRFHPDVMDTLVKLKEVNNELVEQAQAAEAWAGKKGSFKARAGHIGLSHSWTGDWRVPIFDEENNLIYVASGKTSAHADQVARNAFEAFEAQGIKSVVQKPRMRSLDSDNDLMDKLIPFADDAETTTYNDIVRNHRIDSSTSNIAGYEEKMTPKEFLENIIYHNQRIKTYESNLIFDKLYEKDLFNIQQSDPAAYVGLVESIQALRGQKGVIDSAINKTADRFLGPVLGTNSADKIVHGINKFQYAMDLGFGNLAFPLANILQPIQTLFPHVMQLRGTKEEVASRVADLYSMQVGADGKPLGILDTMKMAGKAFKYMGGKVSPEDKALFDKCVSRAVDQGTLHQQFIEDAIGTESTLGQTVKQTLTSRAGFVDFLSSMSSFLPSRSEQLSRGYSFTYSFILGKDILGIKDESKLFQFAKDMTDKTMFRANNYDRAKIFAGPFGSAAGLFKNWANHYLHWHMQYLDDAVARKNYAPLATSMIGTTLLGGATATPLYALAEQLNSFVSDEDLQNQLYDAADGKLGDVMFYGLPSLANISLQNQVSMPFANPIDDAQRFMSLAWSTRGAFLKDGLSQAYAIARNEGRNPLEDSNVQRLLGRAMLPKNIFRLQSSGGMFDLAETKDLLSAKTGNPIFKGMTTTQRLLYNFGLDPVDIAKYSEVSNKLYANKQSKEALMSQLVDAYVEGLREQKEKNKSYLIRRTLLQASAAGLDISNLLKGVQTKIQKTRQDVLEGKYKTEDIMKYASILAED